VFSLGCWERCASIVSRRPKMGAFLRLCVVFVVWWRVAFVLLVFHVERHCVPLACLSWALPHEDMLLCRRFCFCRGVISSVPVTEESLAAAVTSSHFNNNQSCNLVLFVVACVCVWTHMRRTYAGV